MPGLSHTRFAVNYLDDDPDTLLAAEDTLALIGFGSNAPHDADPRYLRVALQPHAGTSLEHWRGSAPVARGRDGDVAWAEDGALQFGAIEIDEAGVSAPTGEDPNDGLQAAAEAAYREVRAFTRARGYRHLLRVWNYLDGITVGDGDQERYRRFCVGRARGLGGAAASELPAATAIGRAAGASDDAPRRLQVYWLASRLPGTPLENPRQLSAYRYPRQYGPQPPSFARAMLPPAGSGMPLLLSGTAAIVGHQSRHADCLRTQLDETLANVSSLIEVAHARQPALPRQLGPQSRLKVYVRDRSDLEAATAALDRRFGADVPRIVLHAAICRRELRIEIDGVHGV